MLWSWMSVWGKWLRWVNSIGVPKANCSGILMSLSSGTIKIKAIKLSSIKWFRVSSKMLFILNMIILIYHLPTKRFIKILHKLISTHSSPSHHLSKPFAMHVILSPRPCPNWRKNMCVSFTNLYTITSIRTGHHCITVPSNKIWYYIPKKFTIIILWSAKSTMTSALSKDVRLWWR